jgi:serine/threonine protein kinase
MSRLAELLVEWEERLEAGQPISAEELCRNEPWLRDSLERQIAKLSIFQKIQEPDATPAAPPSSIGGHAVKRVLGAGSTGIVYLAKDRALRRKVAIKVLSPPVGFLTTEQRWRLAERFKREARTVARLRHEAIVPIFEADLDGAEPYFVMDYLAGGSLEDQLQKSGGKLLGTPAEVVAFMAPVVAAVGHAHAKGVLHRDLKPGNILLQRKSELRLLKPDSASTEPMDGSDPALEVALADAVPFCFADFLPKVSDFGLAKLVDDALMQEDSSVLGSAPSALFDDGSLTQLGRQPGTPAFMAPEQFDIRLGPVGLPADVWAVGAIFYQLLTGRRPFTAQRRADLQRQICQEGFPSPHSLNAQVDSTLERLILRCMERDPARRPTAMELADELARYLQPSTLRRLWRVVSRLPGSPLVV